MTKEIIEIIDYKFNIGDRIYNEHGTEAVIVAAHPSYGAWEKSEWQKEYYFVLFTKGIVRGTTTCYYIKVLEDEFTSFV